MNEKVKSVLGWLYSLFCLLLIVGVICLFI